MKEYRVIYLKSEVKSFSWNDGLFAIIEEKGNTLHMCRIGEDGLPQLHDNGKFMITCTGISNDGINNTSLYLKM